MYCRTQYLCVMIALTCLLVGPSFLLAATLEVEPGGKTGFTTIQEAVDAAVDGDIIVISPGTYAGRGNRDIDLRRKAITIRSTAPEEVSVVEGTILDCEGRVGEPHRGFNVFDFTGEISGLTITNGLASEGGAVRCENSTLALTHCRMVNNGTLPGEVKAGPDGGSGGGLYCLASAVEMVDCLIAGNSTGAGLDSWGTPGGSGGDGAGVCSVDSTVHISQSTIAGNETGAGGSGPEGGPGGKGAGVYAMRITIAESIIEGNTTGTGGDSTDLGRGTGGAGGDGAGVLCRDAIEILDSLVAGNRCGAGGAGATPGADGSGAGLWCAFGLVDRCTIVGNAVTQQAPAPLGGTKASSGLGAGVFCSADTAVTNSVLWGNTPDPLAGYQCDNVLYCNIEGDICPTGLGNIAADPRFVRPGNWVDASAPQVIVEPGDRGAVWAPGDYCLSETSPCIDAGDPDYALDSNVTDVDGQLRVSGRALDMGAYEFQAVQEVQGLTPVYRFRSHTSGKYFYTRDEVEKDRLINEFSHVWTFEGIAYYAYVYAAGPSLAPIHRFWSDSLESHFYTIDPTEKDWLIANYSAVWTYEEPAFYAYPAGSQPPTAKPVYRFWSDSLGHFYTIDEAEKQQYMDMLTGMWIYEGIVWYAFDEPGTGQTPPPSEEETVYEFTGGGDAASYGLELKAYLDGDEARIDRPNVEFAPAGGQMQMVVDSAAMTAQLTEFHVDSEFLHYAGTVSQIGGTIQLPFDMYLYGSFDALAPRGPYDIDPKTLSFPTVPEGGSAAQGETYTVVGSVAVEGEKFDVNLVMNPTEFETDGAAAFVSLDDAGRLDVNMAGAFQWRRSQQEDLLLEAAIRGHVLQFYVTAAQVRATGLWNGKRPQKEEKSVK